MNLSMVNGLANFTLGVSVHPPIAEINDFGYPQNSEIDTLKTYITTESIVSAAIPVVSCSQSL